MCVISACSAVGHAEQTVGCGDTNPTHSVVSVPLLKAKGGGIAQHDGRACSFVIACAFVSTKKTRPGPSAAAAAARAANAAAAGYSPRTVLSASFAPTPNAVPDGALPKPEHCRHSSHAGPEALVHRGQALTSASTRLAICAA
tara:strand:- start:3378 stop:3806 length:429 start_codon:yes stop_codon:yes gene_type:complete